MTYQSNDPKWQFDTETDSYLVAELINRPHEDFPSKVRATQQEITATVYAYHSYHDFIRSGKIGIRINMMVLWMMHCNIFPEAKNHWYRTIPAVIDGVAIPWETIPENMDRISGEFFSVEELQQWYIAFQRIHPFEDGNGRVGGVMLAAGSYVLSRNLSNAAVYTYHVQPDYTERM